MGNIIDFLASFKDAAGVAIRDRYNKAIAVLNNDETSIGPRYKSVPVTAAPFTADWDNRNPGNVISFDYVPALGATDPADLTVRSVRLYVWLNPKTDGPITAVTPDDELLCLGVGDEVFVPYRNFRARVVSSVAAPTAGDRAVIGYGWSPYPEGRKRLSNFPAGASAADIAAALAGLAVDATLVSPATLSMDLDFIDGVAIKATGETGVMPTMFPQGTSVDSAHWNGAPVNIGAGASVEILPSTSRTSAFLNVVTAGGAIWIRRTNVAAAAGLYLRDVDGPIHIPAGGQFFGYNPGGAAVDVSTGRMIY